MKNKLLLLTICLLLFIPGCAVNDNNGGDTIPEKEEEDYGKYSHNGRIVKMDKDGFHVQNDDKVELFNVNIERTGNFYLGEYVKLNSRDGNIYDVTPDEGFDYTSVMTTGMYDEDTKLDLKVEEISRDETGTMRIYGLAADNKEYDIVAGAETVTNFAHSRLKVNDEISVYPENVSDGTPAVVEAKAIIKENTD